MVLGTPSLGQRLGAQEGPWEARAHPRAQPAARAAQPGQKPAQKADAAGLVVSCLACAAATRAAACWKHQTQRCPAVLQSGHPATPAGVSADGTWWDRVPGWAGSLLPLGPLLLPCKPPGSPPRAGAVSPAAPLAPAAGKRRMQRHPETTAGAAAVPSPCSPPQEPHRRDAQLLAPLRLQLPQPARRALWHAAAEPAVVPVCQLAAA